MVNEDEARHRWCPFVRIGVASSGGFYNNRGVRAPTVEQLNVKCLGAQCMAWRWNSPMTGYCGRATPETTEDEL